MSEAPDYARKLMGVRKWHVRHGRLYSTGVLEDNFWTPGADRKATCLKTHRRRAADALTGALHFAPHEDCTCGLYAFVDLDTCNEHGDIFPSVTPQHVVGVVSARGEVIYAGYGFRAEYMSIEALIIGQEYITTFDEEISLMPAYRKLAKTYDVPLIYNSEVMDFMKEMGVVLDAYVPEEEEPEWQAVPPGAMKGVHVPPGAVCTFIAGKPVQAGARLTYDPATRTVRHSRPSEVAIGVALRSAKVGEKGVVIPLPPPQPLSFTPMKPASAVRVPSIKWAYAAAASAWLAVLFYLLWVADAFGLATPWLVMAVAAWLVGMFLAVKLG